MGKIIMFLYNRSRVEQWKACLTLRMHIILTLICCCFLFPAEEVILEIHKIHYCFSRSKWCINILLFLYCYLDGLLKDQIMESNSMLLQKLKTHNMWDELFRVRRENFHFQQALFFRPPAGSSLVSMFLPKEVWWWHICCIKFWNEPDIAVESANKIRLLFTLQESDHKGD